MKATVTIEYRTKRTLGVWTGQCEGVDLGTIMLDMTVRLKKQLRGRITRIDRTSAVKVLA